MSAFSKLLPLDHPIRVFYHYLRGIAAHWYYGRPGRDLIVIGVTGTKGKTTTVNLIARGLTESGKNVFAFSTANYYLDGKWHENTTKMTSPSPFVLQGLLRQAERAGATHAVIETSSHSIFFHRDYGIAYDTVVFTNLSRDHLDLHRNMADYLATKKHLFERLVYYRRKKGIKKIGIVNLDDPVANEFLSVTADTLITYGTSSAAEISAKSVQEGLHDTVITVRMPSSEFQIRSKLRGAFNVSNMLAAVAALVAQKIPSATIAKALSKVEGIPGRLELVPNDRHLRIYVDYAHTDVSLESVLQTVRSIPDRGRIIVVFGATGDRDTDKRPKMGAVADRLADVVIVTDDDAYTEPSTKIISEIVAGISRKLGENFWIVPNREDAIRTALAIAEPSDVVLLAGKWSETVQVTNRGPIKWSDAEATRRILTEIRENEIA